MSKKTSNPKESTENVKGDGGENQLGQVLLDAEIVSVDALPAEPQSPPTDDALLGESDPATLPTEPAPVYTVMATSVLLDMDTANATAATERARGQQVRADEFASQSILDRYLETGAIMAVETPQGAQ